MVARLVIFCMCQLLNISFDVSQFVFTILFVH